MGKVPDPAGDIDRNTAHRLCRALTCTAMNYIVTFHTCYQFKNSPLCL